MNKRIKKPFPTGAEKRAQDRLLRAKSPKVLLPMSWQDLERSRNKGAEGTGV
jgi:hypothetical protein